MMGVFSTKVEEISRSAKFDERITSFLEEERGAKKLRANGPEIPRELPKGSYILCDFRTLQLLGIELNPHVVKVLAIMHRLVSDLGIVDIMNKLLRSETLEKRLLDNENMREETIDSVINEFLEDIKNRVNLKENKWLHLFPTYSVSKVAMNAYTWMLAREMQGKFFVNNLHLRFVQTEMKFGSGDISPVEGTENGVRVALFPPGRASGQFFLEKQFLGF
ncbi:hypothetical protein KI387_022531 [Taxus chinensis]|uniref:Uncharacterized protein n=1 Tax=Taxus chinensis TaxID=29808 RepID=A0AA38G314_TAXCH|nr:hypothetical protein KI387_022531 [Taxus chinensis]